MAQFFIQKLLCIIPEFLSLDAKVVCRWLGFGGGTPTGNSFFGGEANYVMDDVACKGKHVEIYLSYL